jgi:hypothetical protein
VKECCRTISKIPIEDVIKAKIFPELIYLLKSDDDDDVRKEALLAVCNALKNGTSEQCGYLVEQGCISSLCKFLEDNDVIESFKILLKHDQKYKEYFDPEVLKKIV